MRQGTVAFHRCEIELADTAEATRSSNCPSAACMNEWEWKRADATYEEHHLAARGSVRSSPLLSLKLFSCTTMCVYVISLVHNSLQNW